VLKYSLFRSLIGYNLELAISSKSARDERIEREVLVAVDLVERLKTNYEILKQR